MLLRGHSAKKKLVRKRKLDDAAKKNNKARILNDPSLHKGTIGKVISHLGNLQQAIYTAKGSVATSGFFKSQSDILVLVLVLQDVQKCAYTLRALGCNVQKIMDSYEKVQPDSKKVRDVLEHIDEYLLAGGRLQLEKGISSSSLLIYHTGNPQDNASLTITNPSLTVDVVILAESASECIDGLITAAWDKIKSI